MIERSQQDQLKHLYRRMAFSLVPINPLPLKKAIDKLFQDSSSYSPLNYVPLRLDTTGGEQMITDADKESQAMELKKRRNKVRNDNVRNIIALWVQ